VIGDPYEEADQQQRLDEAKLVTPEPAKKNRKIVVAGLVLAGLVLALVILGNIAHLFRSSQPAPSAAVKPTTMTKGQSDSFARQQSGEASYMKGVDGRGRKQNDEDTILGKGANLAGEAGDGYDEADGVPHKTKAQDDAEHGRAKGQGGEKSEAQQLAERVALEAAHRRQNDLDSSPVSVDFSDYFDKQTVSAASATSANAEPTGDSADENLEVRPARKRSVLRGDDASADEEKPAETEAISSKKRVHNPAQDYEFDSSFGKLYRLMEDTILETVLVNRLAGAAVGPVITMITTDVYSLNGTNLLIPRGTRLLGRVTAVSGLNQERLFVAFHRMIMPDGYSVSLDKFQGLDVVGQTGLRDLVNHHYLQIFGASLALAAVSATAQIGNNVGSYGSYGWGTQIRNGVSEGLGQSAQHVLERFLDVLPTFTIRERSRVKVMLSGDLLLPDIKNHTMDPEL